MNTNSITEKISIPWMNDEPKIPSDSDLSRKNLGSEAIKKISQDFESLFLDIVLKSMRQSVMKSGFIDGGNAEEIYRSLLDSEYSKMIAQQGVTGLAETIERQIKDKMHISPQVLQISKEVNGKKLYSQEGLHQDLKRRTIK